MTQQEFESLTGCKVTTEEFKIADCIYMNSGLNKDEFCEAYMHLNPSTFKLVNDLSAGVTHYKNSRNDILERNRIICEDLARKANDYDDDGLRGMARELLGRRNYIAYCISKGLDLDNSDREYIITHLRED